MFAFLTTRRLGLLLIVFVLSGFAGLIYQSIWSHYLGLFLGHAAYAQALVLALFMGGMALGAALVARYGHRWRNLVRTYAVVEALIGAMGLVFHLVFTGLLGLSYDLIMPALSEPWLVNGYKWTLAAGLILPQTILLGMTFPLMSGGLIRRFPGHDGRSLGGLYFANSIGAAVGVLVAAFVLMPRVGLPGAMVAAGIINLLVAAVAWRLGSGGETSRSAPSRLSAGGNHRRLLFVVLAATFLSSAASFAYEIIFVRMLSLAVGSTLHAFELMLASFISGIAMGALWVRRHADRSSMPLRLVGVLQILMGLTALLALALYANAFTWVGFLMESLSPTDGGYALFNLGTAALAILIMMPTAFFAGTTLPLFTVALLRDGQGEPSIGRVYAWNTVGAIVGVFAAIHFLIPVFGVKLAMITAAVVDMGIGLVLLRRVAEGKRDFAGVGAGVAVMFVAMWLVVNLVPFDAMRLSSGVYRTGQVELAESEEVLFYRDGKTASISVTFSDFGVIRMATNGKADASMQTWEGRQPPAEDEPTMVLLGALPLTYQPNARNAAVIGFGSGMTTHVLLGDPGLDQVDTIEIEAEVVNGADWFGERVARAYDDPRSQIIIDDAKSYFAGRQQQYDLIVSEPSNPWISGVGALFSQEFYRFVPRFLTDEGIFLQWLQLYEIDENLVGSVLNAMLPEFADVEGYLSNSGDLLLVAGMQKLDPEPDYQSLFQGELAEELGYVGITDPKQLAFRQVADHRMLRALARLYEYRPNSDFFPVLSLEAPRTRFRGMTPGHLMKLPDLDAPILEWLGVRKPPGLETQLPVYDHFPADMAANEARAIVEWLIDPGNHAHDDLSGNLRNWVAELPLADRICSERSTEVSGDWLIGRLLRLTELTLPYLDPEGLQGVLIDPEWLDCPRPPAGIDRALALVEANARRDAEAMERLGREWLETLEEHPDYMGQMDPFAFASLQFGLIGQGRLQAAGAVESEFGAQVRAAGDYGFARSLILAWLAE